MTLQQRKLLAFRGYNPYDTLGSLQKICGTLEPDAELLRPRRAIRSESDANRWMRRVS